VGGGAGGAGRGAVGGGRAGAPAGRGGVRWAGAGGRAWGRLRSKDGRGERRSLVVATNGSYGERMSEGKIW
jgi:hypothetical protein